MHISSNTTTSKWLVVSFAASFKIRQKKDIQNKTHKNKDRIDLFTNREAFSAKFNQRFRHKNVPLWRERVYFVVLNSFNSKNQVEDNLKRLL